MPADDQQGGDELHEFVRRVSHDLRSPLMAMLGFAELALAAVREEHHDDTRLAGYLERVVANSRHLSHQLDGLASLARMSKPSDHTEFELGPLLRTSLDQVAPPARAQVHLHADVQLVGAREVLSRLLSEIFANSLLHSGRDDVTITVTARDAHDGGVELVIADDGQGVPAGTEESILAPFTQLDPAPAGTGRTGMGLAIAARAAQAFDGTLIIDASCADGCRVVVHIPDERVIRP